MQAPDTSPAATLRRIEAYLNSGHRTRGEALRQSGATRIVELGPNHMAIVVEDRGEQHARIEWNGQYPLVSCSCGFARIGGCEHVFAGIETCKHELRQRPFPNWRELALALGVAWNTALSDEEARSALELLGAQFARSVEAPRPALAEPYEVHEYLLQDSREGGLTILIKRGSKRESRSGRAGGRLRIEDLRQLQPVPEERPLIDMLLGSDARERGPRVRDLQDDGLAVAAANCFEILEALAATGKLHSFLLVDRDAAALRRVHGGPLRVSSRERLRPELRLSGTREHLRLEGWLVRPGFEIALARVDRILGADAALAGNELLHLVAGRTLELLQGLKRQPLPEIPAALLPELCRHLDQRPADLALRVEAELPREAGLCLPVLKLRWDPHTPALLEVELELLYGALPLPAASFFDGGHSALVHTPSGASLLERDAEAEGELRNRLEQLALVPSLVGNRILLSQVTRAALTNLVLHAERWGWRVEAQDRPLRRGRALKVSIQSQTDWFDLRLSADFETQHLSEPELLAALRSKSRMVVLADGSLGLLPEDWLAGWGLLGLGSDRGDGSIRFRASQSLLLDALLAERGLPDAEEQLARLRERLTQVQAPRDEAEPEGFVGELRHYQRLGLGWLLYLERVGLGGCLADDMGLGKTVQILAWIQARHAQAPGQVLVVAPLSLLFNWQREAQRFTPGLTVALHHGPERNPASLPSAAILLTTYSTLRRDIQRLAEHEFSAVVLDEAQAIKNFDSQAARAARLLRTPVRFALTGTPVENSLGDLWSIFEFLCPGMLGPARQFRELFQAPNLGQEDALGIARAVRPLLLRRTKEEVLDDLPDLTEQELYCELEGNQRKEYDKLRLHYRARLLSKVELEGLDASRMHVLEALLRLRQLALHPALIDPAQAQESSAKFDALLPLLEELQAGTHKALVFSQFTGLLDLFETQVRERGWNFTRLDGKTVDREGRVREFQENPDCRLFLLSLKAGGHGLNLTAANYVFLLDPWWNPAVERQAIDRAHRIGQQRPVSAYRLIARDTIEERMLELQAQKRSLAEALFDGESSALRGLTREDLDALLS